MKLRHILVGVLVTATLAAPVVAQDIQDDVEAALIAQGYEIVNVGRTWLGRLRLVAENDEIRREIVINPTTGEVLRDYSVALANLGRPIFPDGDNNDVGDARAAARTTADEPLSDEMLSTGGDLTTEPESGALGAEGAVEAPPLAVDD
jgi:hypothetical protein